MVVEAPPTSSFVMPESNFLLEILIISLNAPAQLCSIDQPSKADCFGQSGQPVFGRLVLTFWPFDQEPFFRSAFSEVIISMRDANSRAGKAPRQPIGRTLSLLDRAPGLLRKTKSKLLDQNGLMIGVATQPLRRLPSARPFFRRQWTRAGFPHRSVGLDAGCHR